MIGIKTALEELKDSIQTQEDLKSMKVRIYFITEISVDISYNIENFPHRLDINTKSLGSIFRKYLAEDGRYINVPIRFVLSTLGDGYSHHEIIAG